MMLLLAQILAFVAVVAVGVAAACAFGLVWAWLITSLDRSMGSGFTPHPSRSTPGGSDPISESEATR